MKSISTRIDAVETSLRTNMESTRQNGNALDAISHALRRLQDSVDRHGTTSATAKDAEDGQDTADAAGHAHTPRKAATSATNKDLLRRLKRGFLVQFDHDEPSEEQNAPARKVRFIDVLKREVRAIHYLPALIARSYPAPSPNTSLPQLRNSRVRIAREERCSCYRVCPSSRGGATRVALPPARRVAARGKSVRCSRRPHGWARKAGPNSPTEPLN